ncbi:MAG: AAA family ATPase [Anaerolineales bacterium]|nr:AAA family ATPase [Anaerolineales bacterium]
MREAGAEIEGERKPVTILFTDIVGSTVIAEKLDPEEWREVVQGAHRRVSDAIYRYEGTIAQLLGDGVLAFFGAPITHEDDPERAVRAALDIQGSIDDYQGDLAGVVDDFQMRIGINTGIVVIGDVGTDMHVEYLAIGDAVNVAARLQSEADPGGVLISESVARMVDATFELEDLGEITIKGKVEPVHAFEVHGAMVEPDLARGIEGLKAPFVAREQEFELLQGLILKLCGGHGGIVTLIGDVGIGKTRLLEEVRIHAYEENAVEDEASYSPKSIRWLEGRALSYGRSLSYWVITQLLLDDLGLSDGAPEVKIKVALRKRVMTLFGEEGYAEVFPYLAHLLDLTQDQEDAGRIEMLGGEAVNRQVQLSLRKYFNRVAKEQPTILVLEDMHWADPSSLEAIQHLLGVTESAPLMILMLMRIDRDHGSWGLKLKAETDFPHRTTGIHLRRLGNEESVELMERLLSIEALPSNFQKLILSRSEGNPFYLEEVIRHLVEQRLIVQVDEGWQVVEEIEEIGIPDTLQGILLARIDRLEKDVRHTLQLASVIGKSFLYRILEAISEAEKELNTHLTELQRADLVREKAKFPELEYMFKHSLTQEAAYNSLLQERRREFHRRVGEALEELFPDRQEEFLGLLGHHFEAAGEREKAVAYLIRSGDKTRHEDALEVAIEYYDRALKLLSDSGDDEQAAKIWLKMGVVYQLNFEFDRAHQAYETAFTLEYGLKQKPKVARVPKVVERDPRRILRTSYSRWHDHSTIDPHRIAHLSETLMASQVYSGLTRYDKNIDIIPNVARSWEVLEGGRRYLFHLRDDVFWTDGNPVTAEDFVQGWLRGLSTSVYAFQFDDVIGAREFRLGQIEDPGLVGIQAIDPLTLEVRLNAPVAHFIYLSASQLTYPLPPKAIERFGEEWWKPENVVSNGPFCLVDWSDDGFELERNLTYFGDYSGNLDRYEVLIIQEEEQIAQTLIEKYLEEEIDIAIGLNPPEVPEGVPIEDRHDWMPSITELLAFNSTQTPLDNPLVRKALAQALDRSRLIEVEDISCLVARGGLVPPGAIPGHSPDIGIQYDVEGARRNLAEAGYPGGRDFPKLRLIHFPRSEKWLAEIARQWMEALGIEVQMSKGVWGGRREDHIYNVGWMSELLDPHDILYNFAQGLLEIFGVRDPRYEELIKEGACTTERAQRIALYRQADEYLVSEKVLFVPIFYGTRLVNLIKPWVKNFRQNAIGYYFLQDVVIEDR